MSSITKLFIYSQQLYMAYVPNTVMYEAMLRHSLTISVLQDVLFVCKY